MGPNSNEREPNTPRWRYLALAALIFLLASAMMALLWQVPQLFPHWVGLAPTETPTALPPTSTPTLTPTPAILEPSITELSAVADDEARTITFHLAAEVPPDREIAEVLLWYDTEIGRRVRRTAGPLFDSANIQYRLDALQEGLTRTLTTTRELDYWWLVRDTSGESARAGGTVLLEPNLQSLVTVPPGPPPIEVTWTMSQSHHFEFYYLPDTAAERDRFQIGALAEASLAEIRSVLGIEFDDQMSIYLVPRIFWQGGAAYGEKVQLISYLDRNYTGIEIWSYFTHEGTHALAQDLIQPKENGGGPDGVLVEGLAVWASDGHYRREPIDAWAAVVVASDDYLPLADLRTGPFYEFQHETSYLEGASFVKFLIDRVGLDTFKTLYGQATGDAAHDEALVRLLYGQGYDALEAEWLDYLAGLDPTPDQTETWRLKVRSFDLMRRYETELDPDARLLPSTAPPEWLSDTFRVFLDRADRPVNVVLETALIAAQEAVYGGLAPGAEPSAGDLARAAALLDDVEAALDAGGVLTSTSLAARLAIVEAVAAQDRAILRGDVDAYRDTLAPASSLAADEALAEILEPPFTAFGQEVVRLDLSDDGLSASGVVLLHAHLYGGEFDGDGRLFAVAFVKVGDRWLMTAREPVQPELSLLPADGG